MGAKVELILRKIMAASKVDKAAAIRIAKSRGLIRQSGEHLVAAGKRGK